MRRSIISALILMGLAFAGCQHNPVYPDVGSVYINSDPEGAEVLLDGVMTRRITPVKMDGIPVGAHAISLRHNNYKTMSVSFEIKPGQTRRIYKELDQISLWRRDTLGTTSGDMDVDPEEGTVYLSDLTGGRIKAVRVDSDGQIAMIDQIEAGGAQRLIAARRSANRVFATRIREDGEEEIVAIDLLSHKVVRTLYLRDIKYYSALTFSPDGSVLAAADSLNRKLVLIDSRLCAVIKTINTAGCPTDLCFDRNNPAQLYVTQGAANLFAQIDLETGTVVNSIGTGNSPGGIFWDNYGTQVGLCNRSDLTYTVVDIGDWTKATSDQDIVGANIVGACWSSNDIYVLWAVDNMVGTMYMPFWEQTSKIYNGSRSPMPLVELSMTVDRKHLLMLNRAEFVTVEPDL